MNGRKLFKEYAQSKGKEAKEFVSVESEQYNYDKLTTKSNDGSAEVTSIDYKEMVHWIIKNYKLWK